MSRSRTNRTRSANSSGSAATYGYHNTYHTHAQLPLGSPPSYACAMDPKTRKRLDERARAEKEAVRNMQLPPPYTCTVEMQGIVGLKHELSSPFQVSSHREWSDVYAILRGTQLNLYRIKNPHLLSKSKTASPGRLLKSFSLQHAEVGVASDVKRSPLVPKSPFVHLVPVTARAKLYESDPQLFEPVREHPIRLRLEFEQFLLCPASEESMLDWIESFCAAIDISSPLEDRSEPRYRSLPRRSRRQRVLDAAQIGDNLESLSNMEAGRRLIAEQEQIMRQLYPNLAGTREQSASRHSPSADAELDDFDPEDVRFPTREAADPLTRISSQGHDQADEDQPDSQSSSDHKSMAPVAPTPAQTMRYRRRCAPVLLASSPRVSDVVFAKGQRFRISVKAHMLVDYATHPPRYDAHGFPKNRRPSHAAITQEPPAVATEEIAPVTVVPERPSSPVRGISDDSITSITFGEDLAPINSKSNIDETGQSGPPSPTGKSHVTADAARQLEAMGKRRPSVESREASLNPLNLGVGLLI
ncbi:uncharacterized protein yc1106_10080 [Curvularia clavata]|uniref:PH domain-containing protein n=1 Tax=Curvularia clavata TaxID=95742 RepID=A0A9Q9DYN2_CURCL|nr:uncharacterized protein yc1106_10080 [Curvularia clavata]